MELAGALHKMGTGGAGARACQPLPRSLLEAVLGSPEWLLLNKSSQSHSHTHRGSEPSPGTTCMQSSGTRKCLL